MRESSYDVFVSYAQEDLPSARTIHEALRAAGVKSWFAPEGIPAASRYGEILFDAIEASRILLLVFTPATNQSGMVDREVGLAGSLGIPILPVRVGRGEPSKSLRFFIGTHNWFEVVGSLQDSLSALVDAVRASLDRESSPPLPTVGLLRRSLVVFSTMTQITEIWATERGLELYLYDLKAGEARRQLAFSPKEIRAILDADDIEVKPRSRYKTCGVFRIGECGRWLYDKSLYPDPTILHSALRSLMETAIQSRPD